MNELEKLIGTKLTVEERKRRGVEVKTGAKILGLSYLDDYAMRNSKSSNAKLF